ncbi:MAG: glycoside hydrolase family 3 protein [Thermomicrobiales bacterium]|nr:glycoside hydrolase family 3 protein [Thermomicrobiales bacterium]
MTERLNRRMLLAGTAALAAGTVWPRRSIASLAKVVEGTLTALSLTERIAQLFLVPVASTALTAEEETWLRTAKPGGVLLLGSNMGTPEEIATLIAAIRATNPDVPPAVAADQEGGLVTRLPGDPAPGALELGALPDEEVAAYARQRAEFLTDYGVTVNLAPVADIAWTPDSFMAGRSFGSDPATVADKVAAYLRGAAGVDVAHCVKHFPGHGRGATDSHVALPIVDLSLEEWRATDGVPFAAAVAAEAPMVMLGHLLYPQWDARPASLSPEAVRVLREDLGFAGAIVTDDLGMEALAAYGPLETLDLAFAAGVDWFLYAILPLPPRDLIDHLARRVERGDIDGADIDDRVRRVLAVKLGAGAG